MAPSLLPSLEQDVVTELTRYTRTLGVDLHTGVTVKAIRRVGEGVEVDFVEADGASRTVSASAAANGAGRVPALEGMDLHAAGVELAEGRPVVEPDLRARGNPNIVFAGDVLAGRPQLSPVATWEGLSIEVRTNDMREWRSGKTRAETLA